jgi:hypothetical protein
LPSRRFFLALGRAVEVEHRVHCICQRPVLVSITQEDLMRLSIRAVVAAVILVLAVACAGLWRTRARNAHHATAPPALAPSAILSPIDQYLMPDRDAEIALARSAAPEDISRGATILVLGRHGYETAIKGTNGFACLVERSWMGPLEAMNFGSKNRAPLCLNPQAVRFILPIDYKRTELALGGKSKEQIIEWTKTAYVKGELPGFEPGAMSYMMSKAAILDEQGHNLAHLMFYTPVINGVEWGADVPHSPILSFSQGPPEPFNTYLVPTGEWSDGTSAPLPK